MRKRLCLYRGMPFLDLTTNAFWVLMLFNVGCDNGPHVKTILKNPPPGRYSTYLLMSFSPQKNLKILSG